MLSPLELAAGNLSSVNVFQFKFIQNLAESEASIEVNPTGLMNDSANWEGNFARLLIRQSEFNLVLLAASGKLPWENKYLYEIKNQSIILNKSAETLQIGIFLFVTEPQNFSHEIFMIVYLVSWKSLTRKLPK